jgi:dipeptidyl-peptidase III
MKHLLLLSIIILIVMVTSCKKEKKETSENAFQFLVEQFADVKIMRYQVPGFDELTLGQKKLLYYLSQAAIEGRDILFDQNYRYNLAVRRSLEAIYDNFEGDRSSDEFKQFEIYLKRVWFSNGIHHHYSTDKFEPGFSSAYFAFLLDEINESELPMYENESKDDFIARLQPVIFDTNFEHKRVNQADGEDLLLTSANNYWGKDITQAEAEKFYASLKNPDDQEPISYGLNSRLVKENGMLVEKVWHIGGTYSQAIEKIVFWLKNASEVAENEQQKMVIDYLVSYYETGNLKTFDLYNIAWLNDHQSHIDFINGFIETYGDPLGIKGSWESLVNFKNIEATKRTQIISSNAQWFEDNSPVDPRFKKPTVKGVSAKVITAAMLGGDCYPATPIGINLPNSNWIRKEHGSKSVTIENITYAYDKAAEGNGFLEEFCFSPEEIEREHKYGFVSDNLHTDLHECLGHGSGQLLPGVSGDELKAYGATIEEARADLFALYYIGDKAMVELGLLPDGEAYKALYDGYIRNGLMTQLTRVQLGKDIEESHMRNRQLIAQWAYEKGMDEKVIEKVTKEGETYFMINNYEKLRLLFGELLAEVQRIKSEGDFEASRLLVENYAVKVDRVLHAEVLERFKKLNLAPYGGFLNPVYVPETNAKGEIINIKLDYTESYTDQMMRYSKEHSWLPTYN